MGTHFQQELDALKLTVLQMASLAERAISRASRAFFERNAHLAQEVIDGDQDINLLEVEVDRVSLRLLALDQPLAGDLRFIVGCMRIAVDLERIGDQAVNVAERAIFLSSRPSLPPSKAMEELAETALEMYRNVVRAFIDQNAEQAREVCRMDDRADGLNVAVLKSLLDHMVRDVPAVERSVQTIIAARCLERVADQATNIAESVIFMALGVNIKHHSWG